jgi:hypothetical protein
MLLGDRDRLNYFMIDKAILKYEYVSLMGFVWKEMKDFCDS